MITQLLTTLLAAEKTAETVVETAKTAYATARGTGMLPAKLAELSPGRHIIALGAIRSAISRVKQLTDAVPGSATVPVVRAGVPPAATADTRPPTPPGAIKNSGS